MNAICRVGGFLLASLLFCLSWAESSDLVYTNAAFKKVLKSGFVVAFFYRLDEQDQKKILLQDGTEDHAIRWHEVNRIDEIISRLETEEDYADIVTCIRVNLARGDLASLQEKYHITGDSVLLFEYGVQVGNNIPVSKDFKLSMLKKTDSWLKFDDFIQQEITDRRQAERDKKARDRERRRVYDYYYGPRPYLSFGFGGGYYGYGPGWWGGGWGSPYVGFGFSI